MVFDDRTITIVVTVRERFSLSEASLAAIYDNTPPGFRLIYVVGGAPKGIERWLAAEAVRRGFELVTRACFLTPNESRNIGLARARSERVIFIENDVVPSQGWMEALVRCADETGAEVIAPLICEGEPLHQTIHQAGGALSTDLATFFATPRGERTIREVHSLQGQPRSVVGYEQTVVESGEFHCIMINRDFLLNMGGFDELMMSTREHLDFAISVYEQGGTVMLAPTAVVTFLMPWAGQSLDWCDLHFHLVRWSPLWARRTISRFQEKWGVDPRQRHDRFVNWRYTGDIVKPLVRKLPVFGRSKLFGSIASRTLVPLLRLVGNLAAMHASHVRASTRAPLRAPGGRLRLRSRMPVRL